MDLSTGHAAYTLHAQEAQRSARALEHRRVANERAAELATSAASAGAPIPVRHRRFFVFSLLGHRASAQ
jgi:hypothetical protein